MVWPCLAGTSEGSWEPLGEPLEPWWELVGALGYLWGLLETLGGAMEASAGAMSGSEKEIVKRFGWSGSDKEIMKRIGPVWRKKGDGEKVLPGLGTFGGSWSPWGGPMEASVGAASGSEKEIMKRFGPVCVREGDSEKVWPCLAPKRKW